MVVTRKMIEALKKVRRYVGRREKPEPEPKRPKIDGRPGAGVGRKRAARRAKKLAEQLQRRAEMKAAGLL
jgi:hypothetical protein